jgi:hypothetical protein
MLYASYHSPLACEFRFVRNETLTPQRAKYILLKACLVKYLRNHETLLVMIFCRCIIYFLYIYATCGFWEIRKIICYSTDRANWHRKTVTFKFQKVRLFIRWVKENGYMLIERMGCIGACYSTFPIRVWYTTAYSRMCVYLLAKVIIEVILLTNVCWKMQVLTWL